MPAKGKSHKPGGRLVPYKMIDEPDNQSRPSAQANIKTPKAKLLDVEGRSSSEQNQKVNLSRKPIEMQVGSQLTPCRGISSRRQSPDGKCSNRHTHDGPGRTRQKVLDREHPAGNEELSELEDTDIRDKCESEPMRANDLPRSQNRHGPEQQVRQSMLEFVRHDNNVGTICCGHPGQQCDGEIAQACAEKSGGP